MDQGIAALWGSSLAVLGTLGGAWVQRHAAVLQVREEAGAQARARLWEERRAAYARVLDRCDDAHAAFAQVWELRQEAAGGAPLAAPTGPGPVRDAAQDARRTLAELGLGTASGLEELRAELAGLEEQYHVAYGAFTTAAQGVPAPDEDG